MATSNTQDLIVDGAELWEPVTIKRDKISRMYHVTAYPTQLTRNTTVHNADGIAKPDPITVRKCRWYTAGIIRFHTNPETGFICKARPELHELEVTLECLLEESHKQQLAKRAQEIYGLQFTADNFVICPFQAFIAQLTIGIDGVVKTFYGTLIDNRELHPMRIIFTIEDLDELSKITSKLDRPHDHDIVLRYSYSLIGTSTAHSSLNISAEEVSQINLEKQIFGTSNAESMLVSRSFLDKVSTGISSRLKVVESIGVGASSFGQDLIKQEIVNAISEGGLKKFSIDDIKQMQSNAVGITDDLKANKINSMSANQTNSTASGHDSLDASSSANSSNILHANSGANHQSGNQSSNSTQSNELNVGISTPWKIGADVDNKYGNTNASTSAYDNSNNWTNRDHAHVDNQSSHLNKSSGTNSNSNATNNTIHGEIQQTKNIDAAIIHRWQITNGFTISLNRWHHQMAKTSIEGRITTKDDAETLAEIQTRQEKAQLQAEVIRQERDTITAVVLGETGSGKSSLIDLFYFWARESCGGQPNFEDVKRHSIISNENEAGGSQSGSQTLKPHRYKFVLNFEDRAYNFLLLDTPGMGDIKGLKQDDEHIMAILKFVEDTPAVNGIMLMLNGSNCRVSSRTQYILQCLYGMCPKTFENHIYLIFSNTQIEPNFDWKKEIKVPIRNENVIPIDNLLFSPGGLKYSTYNQIQRRKIETNYNENKEILNMIFQQLIKGGALETDAYKDLRETRDKLRVKVSGILMAIKQSNYIKDQIEKELRDLHSTTPKHDELLKKSELRINQVKITQQDTLYHNTQCLTCSATCHENCHLEFTAISGHNIFSGCACMDEGICKNCKHDYTTHVHTKFIYKSEIISKALITEEERKELESITKTLKLQDFMIQRIQSDHNSILKQIDELSSDLETALRQLKNLCSHYDYKMDLRCIIKLLKDDECVDDVRHNQADLRDLEAYFIELIEQIDQGQAS